MSPKRMIQGLGANAQVALRLLTHRREMVKVCQAHFVPYVMHSPIGTSASFSGASRS